MVRPNISGRDNEGNRGQRPSGSGRSAGVSPSSARVAARGSARSSQRGGAGGSFRGSRRTTKSGGTELIILGSVIGVLAVIVIFVFIWVNNRNQSTLAEKHREERFNKKCRELAISAFARVEKLGRDFVMGKIDPKISREELFKDFLSDDTFYNIMFVRRYSQRKQEGTDPRKMHEEITEVGISNKPIPSEGDLRITFGQASHDKSSEKLVWAEKSFQPDDPKEKVNLGGKVVVLIRAPKE
jgi:hypothetical protein